jgi:hypothetical protein
MKRTQWEHIGNMEENKKYLSHPPPPKTKKLNP